MTSSSKPAQSMAELMAQKGNALNSLQKGQTITGVITKLTPQDVMMQMENKTDIMVLAKDRKLYRQLLNILKVGDKVDAVVLYPESDAGYPAVTLRHFMEGKVWEELEKLQKSGEKVSVTVTESTKGGLVVETENGMGGFLPNSYITSGTKAEELVGKKINASIIEIIKQAKKVVFSQKAVLSSDDFKDIAKTYAVGTKISGAIVSITTFGMFVSLPFKKGDDATTIDGLVHISEVSWEKVEDLHALYEVGQKVEAVVIGVDPRSKRIDLSIKKLTKDPFQIVLDRFPLDKKVTGIVHDMTEGGLEIDLGEVDGVKVEGLIKKDKISPTTTYEKGQKITATVVSIDSRKRKVMLTPVLMEKPLMYR